MTDQEAKIQDSSLETWLQMLNLICDQDFGADYVKAFCSAIRETGDRAPEGLRMLEDSINRGELRYVPSTN